MLGKCARAGDRGRRSDVLQAGRLELVADAATEHGDISALPASVGVELVESQELQPLRRLDDRLFRHPSEDQLEHHVVGEDDVRRIVANLATLFVGLLAGVATDADGGMVLVERLRLEKLCQLAELAVGEGVHRVDDDRLDSLAGTVSQHVVDDRDDVAQALSGAGPGREDVVGPRAGDADRLVLMLVEPHREAGAVGGLPSPEDLGTRPMEQPLTDEIVDRPPRLEGGVQLHERRGPQHTTAEGAVDHLLDTFVGDIDERPHEGVVIANEPVAHLEDVHGDAR